MNIQLLGIVLIIMLLIVVLINRSIKPMVTRPYTIQMYANALDTNEQVLIDLFRFNSVIIPFQHIETTEIEPITGLICQQPILPENLRIKDAQCTLQTTNIQIQYCIDKQQINQEIVLQFQNKLIKPIPLVIYNRPKTQKSPVSDIYMDENVALFEFMTQCSQKAEDFDSLQLLDGYHKQCAKLMSIIKNNFQQYILKQQQTVNMECSTDRPPFIRIKSYLSGHQ